MEVIVEQPGYIGSVEYIQSIFIFQEIKIFSWQHLSSMISN